MVSQLNRWIVREYAEFLQGQDGVVVLGMHGLTVEEAQDLRRRVRNSGARLQVVRRRLARQVFREIGIELDEEVFNGPCALLVGDTDQAISATKAIEEMWRKAADRKIEYRGAFFDGSVLGPAEAARIPTMPDKQTMRAMLCSAILGPARMLATALREVPASTARVLQARADQEDQA